MNIQEIKSQLPNGALREISQKSGIHYATVQSFFAGNKTKANLSLMRVTAEYLKDYKKAKAQAEKELEAVVNT